MYLIDATIFKGGLLPFLLYQSTDVIEKSKI